MQLSLKVTLCTWRPCVCMGPIFSELKLQKRQHASERTPQQESHFALSISSGGARLNLGLWSDSAISILSLDRLPSCESSGRRTRKEPARWKGCPPVCSERNKRRLISEHYVSGNRPLNPDASWDLQAVAEPSLSLSFSLFFNDIPAVQTPSLPPVPPSIHPPPSLAAHLLFARLAAGAGPTPLPCVKNGS
jgi:hypothetical protein